MKLYSPAWLQNVTIVCDGRDKNKQKMHFFHIRQSKKAVLR